MPEPHYIDVYFSVQAFTEENLRGKTAVIIDILRATSSIVTAIHNGAKKIIPVEDMSDAVKIARTMDANDYLLCGEKDGVKIEGYHLGNSPQEYTREAIADQTLIFNTTNGTKAIKKAALANRIYIGAFLNQQAVIDALKEHDDEVVLICSGWRGRVSLEDTLFAGSLLYQLFDKKLPESTKDGAKMAFSLYEKFGSQLEETIQKSDHAYRLKNLVPEGDISFCCQINKFDVLPGMCDGLITNLNG